MHQNPFDSATAPHLHTATDTIIAAFIAGEPLAGENDDRTIRLGLVVSELFKRYCNRLTVEEAGELFNEIFTLDPYNQRLFAAIYKPKSLNELTGQIGQMLIIDRLEAIPELATIESRRLTLDLDRISSS